MNEAVEEGARGNGGIGGKVEDGVVIVTARNLEVDDKEEGPEGSASGMGATKGGGGNAVVGLVENFVEAGRGNVMW